MHIRDPWADGDPWRRKVVAGRPPGASRPPSLGGVDEFTQAESTREVDTGRAASATEGLGGGGGLMWDLGLRGLIPPAAPAACSR